MVSISKIPHLFVRGFQLNWHHGAILLEMRLLPQFLRDWSLSKSHANASSPDTFTAKLQDTGIWKDAPILKGVTRFEPNQDTKNIMITGGAGFM